jgi:hypothetical protein
VAVGAAAALLFGGCSSGDAGLVLGRPSAQVEGGSAGASATATAGGGDAAGTGGTSGLAGAAPEAGAAGAGAPPSDPPWIQDACTPIVKLENRDTTSQGQLFTDAVPDPSEVVWAASHAACRLLFRSASEVKPVTEVSLVVEDYAGIAGTAGNTLRLSTRYLKSRADQGADLRTEIVGILHFATSLVYQNQGADMDPAPPGWLIVGIADCVRLESGYIDRNQRSKGGSYDGSSQQTAFFLDYLATKNPNIVYHLNQRLASTSPRWTNDVFVTLTGNDLNTLWAEYQATL